MTNVSIVFLDLPLITSRGQTVPKLGTKVLSDFWDSSAALLYKPGRLSLPKLVETRLEAERLTRAITESPLYRNQDIGATVHVVASASDIRKYPVLAKILSSRLPHNQILYHLLSDSINLDDVTAAFGDQKTTLTADDLVITLDGDFTDHYPAAKVVTATGPAYQGIVITNHTGSYFSDSHLYRPDNWLASFVDEYQAAVNPDIVLSLDLKQPDATDERLSELIKYLTNQQIELMFFGWPGSKEHLGSWHPVGFTGRAANHQIESALEGFDQNDLELAWRHHHGLEDAPPRMSQWVKDL